MAWARGGAGGRGRASAGGGGCLGEVELGELDVDRQQQGRCPALKGCVGGVRQRAAGGLGTRRHEGADAGGAQHAGGIEALVVRTERIDRPG